MSGFPPSFSSTVLNTGQASTAEHSLSVDQLSTTGEPSRIDESLDGSYTPNGNQLPRHSKKQSSWVWSFFTDPRSIIGLVAVIIVVALAFFGPLLAPYSATEIVSRPYQGPSSGHLLGTDVLGRDAMSILMLGGRSFIIEGFLAALIGVGLGGIIGIIIGLLSGKLRTALLFSNDTIMVIPQILIVLIVIAAFSANAITLTMAVAVAQIPYAARVVQAATKRIVHEDYFIAGQMAGQSQISLMIREVLPNIAGPLLVEFGVRLCISFVVLASLSYLGFSAGAGDWGQMIHDNKGGISIQPWAVLSPIGCISVFLIGMNLLRDRASNALSGA
jgi:peptide/nickel transport system permease protein